MLGGDGGTGGLRFAGRFFCRSSITLFFTMFSIESCNEGDPVALG
jgi:hypothetical protein